MGKAEIKRPKPFNPLDKKHLGEIVADHMLNSTPEGLPPEKFIGAGIYAIYYTGDNPVYTKLASKNSKKLKAPIYVGKAVPEGARKGGLGLEVDPGIVLYKRLNEHAKSIIQATNLNIEDFRCRYLVVDDIWIPLAESILIETYRPLWNMVVDGFGNHDPGKGRYDQQMSYWDTIHPGRSWAKKTQKNTTSKADIIIKINEHLKKRK